MKDCPHCKLFMRGNYFGKRNCPTGRYMQSWCRVCRWNKWHKGPDMAWQKDKNGRMLMREVMVVV